MFAVDVVLCNKSKEYDSPVVVIVLNSWAARRMMMSTSHFYYYTISCSVS